MRVEAFLIVTLLSAISPRAVLCQGDSPSSRANDLQPRFASFETAPTGRFPYMCSLRFNADRSKHACGGILIHPSWILTAAHCVDPMAPGSTGLVPIVYCGIHDIADDSEDLVFATVEGIMHEDWDRDFNKGNDIAMLKLDKEAAVTFPRLNVPNSRPEPGRSLDGLGWGETSDGREATKLQLAENLIAVSHRVCNERWDGALDEDTVLCAGIGENDACKGDSGGPLLHADTPGGSVKNGNPRFDLIVGIVSFGDGSCGTSTKPGVYTDVGYYREWIFGIIEGRPSPSTGSVQSSQPDQCPASPKLENIVAAIEDDVVSIVRAALDCGLDPGSRYNDTTISHDSTLLHWAARFDSSDSAKALVESGADVEAKDSFGDTALHKCGIFGSVSVSKVLLDNKASVNVKGNGGWRPLHYAAREGSDDIAKFLLDRGADVDARDDYGETPLHWAAVRGRADTVKILLEAGAGIDATDSIGETPLHEAAEYGNLDTARVLVEAGASKTIRDENGDTPEDVVCDRADPECSSATQLALEDLLAP